MKKLILIRHAKAEHESKNDTDFERPLSFWGKEDAGKMALLLQRENHLPQMIVCSPALRTVETAEIFTDILGIKEASKFYAIYEAASMDLLRIVNLFDDEKETIALFGHNPGVSDLLAYLTDESISMQPGSWAIVELNVVKWAEVGKLDGKMVDFEQP